VTTILGLDTASIADPKPIDWRKVYAAGYRFAIHRATWGAYHDPEYPREAPAARAAGLVVGAYCLIRWTEPITPQLEAVRSLVVEEADFCPVIDVEFGKGGRLATKLSGAACVDRVLAMCGAGEDAHGGTAGIYSSRQQWVGAGLPAVPELATRWLWLASHEGGPAPEPPGWDLGSLWVEQVAYNVRGVPGVKGLIDRDEYRVMRRGERSGRVAWVQVRVGAGADGIFGPATEVALKRWQKRTGIEATGEVGIVDFARLTRVAPGWED